MGAETGRELGTETGIDPGTVTGTDAGTVTGMDPGTVAGVETGIEPEEITFTGVLKPLLAGGGGRPEDPGNGVDEGGPLEADLVQSVKLISF
jgi:hypothetical protein